MSAKALTRAACALLQNELGHDKISASTICKLERIAARVRSRILGTTKDKFAAVEETSETSAQVRARCIQEARANPVGAVIDLCFEEGAL